MNQQARLLLGATAALGAAYWFFNWQLATGVSDDPDTMILTGGGSAVAEAQRLALKERILDYISGANPALSNETQELVSSVLLKQSMALRIDDIPTLLAICQKESNFNPTSRGANDDRGLMQVTPVGFAQARIVDPAIPNERDKLFDPAFNIWAGWRLWTYWRRQAKGDLRQAYAMYNGGWNPPAQSYLNADRFLSFRRRIVGSITTA